MAYGSTHKTPTAGMASGSGGWEPSVKYLLVLLLAEVFAFGLLMSLTHRGG